MLVSCSVLSQSPGEDCMNIVRFGAKMEVSGQSAAFCHLSITTLGHWNIL